MINSYHYLVTVQYEKYVFCFYLDVSLPWIVRTLEMSCGHWSAPAQKKDVTSCCFFWRITAMNCVQQTDVHISWCRRWNVTANIYPATVLWFQGRHQIVWIKTRALVTTWCQEIIQTLLLASPLCTGSLYVPHSDVTWNIRILQIARTMQI